MRKILISCSVLLLAACGGGSGGGAPKSNNTPFLPTNVLTNNKKVTGMASEIWIAKDGTSSDIVRGATGSAQLHGKEYTKYMLDDVKFTTGDAFDSESFTFSIDDSGAINKIKFARDNFANSEQVRNGTTNDFNVTVTNPNYPNNPANTKLTYESYGKGQGLRYSDFGVLITRGIDGHEWMQNDETMAYIGGYEAKKVSKDDFAENVKFRGRAQGTVSGAGNEKVLRDDAAWLRVDKSTGKETLTAVFDGWYNVAIEKNGNNVTFGISGTPTDSQYVLATPTENLAQDRTEGNYEAVKFDTAYYGTTSDPREAVALFNYSQGDNPGGETQNYKHVVIGFGGKVQP